MKIIYCGERKYTKEEEERGYKVQNFFTISEYQDDKLLLEINTRVLETGNIHSAVFVMDKKNELELLKVLQERNKK
jgi:hypothetical protein